MAWLAVNKDGTEWIMPGKPVRGWCGHWEYSEKVYVESEQGYVSIEIELPKGSVYKLLGKECIGSICPKHAGKKNFPLRI